jgi:molybdopterin converting factor subunit 1
MKIRLLLFALVRDSVGQSEVELDLPEGSTVGNLRHRFVELYPQTEVLLAGCAISVNQKYATDSTSLEEAHEVAIIPPVSGG